jgi:hypothetical protein
LGSLQSNTAPQGLCIDSKKHETWIQLLFVHGEQPTLSTQSATDVAIGLEALLRYSREQREFNVSAPAPHSTNSEFSHDGAGRTRKQRIGNRRKLRQLLRIA